MTTFHAYAAGHLFGIALDALRRASTAPSSTSPAQADACVAAIMAAAALEAFINEVAFAARDPLVVDQVVHRLGDALKAVEQASLESKYQIAHLCLVGLPYDQGAPPYQDFVLLIKLRNNIVHRRTETFAMSEDWERTSRNAVLEGLRTRGVVSTEAGEFMFIVETKAMAEWACNTVRSFARHLVAAMPSDFQTQLQAMYPILLNAAA